MRYHSTAMSLEQYQGDKMQNIQMQIDPEQIRQFVTALFHHARPDRWANLRAFTHDNGTFEIEPVQADLVQVIDHATKMAARCAAAPGPVVFCPPVVTFHTADNAKEANVAQGLVLTVDSDENAPATARERLESLLGPATQVVASGGVWTCPETGEMQDKLHLHWRLACPTETPEDHARLKHARELATHIAGADKSNVPLVHPIRWPGSVHRKGEPRLARIIAATDAEIDLDDALVRLAAATGQDAAPFLAVMPAPAVPVGPDRMAEVRTYLKDYIVPPPGRPEWQPLVAAIHESTGGSAEGLAIAHEWSARDPVQYNPTMLDSQWRSYTLGLPHAANIGTLRRLAGQAGAPLNQIIPLKDQLPEWADIKLPSGASLTPVQAIHRTAPTFTFVAVGDLEARPPAFLIDGLMETDTLGLIFGDPGCGKSFIAADMALSVATGEPFHGRPTKQGPVFFIAGEGHSGLARRFQAWARHRGRGLAGVPMFKSDRAAQFLDATSAQAVADAVDALVSAHGVPRLIVVDTLARNFGPGDENSTSEMSAFVAAMDELRGRHPGCVVLIVHHSGHGDKQRARGAMALKGALDFECRAEMDDATICVTVTKMKDAPDPAPMAFRLQGVPLDDGASSAVLVSTVAPSGAGKLTKNQRLALRAFKTAADEQDGHGGLHLSQWTAAFVKIHTGSTPENKKRMFSRARDELQTKGLVSVEDDIYIIADGRALNSDGLPDFSGFVRTSPTGQGGQTGQMPIGMSGVRPNAGGMPGIN